MARLVGQVAVVEEGRRLQCLSMTSPSHESPNIQRIRS